MKKILIILILTITCLSIKAITHNVAIGQQYSDKTISNGDIVLFEKGGIYSPFSIENSNITIGSYGIGLNPIISGFQTITGWTNDGGGVYSKVINPQSPPNMLIIDGIQYAIGRYPNSSNLTYESSNTNISITDNQLSDSPNWTGAEVVIYKNGYTLDRCLITGQSSGLITYTNLGTTRNSNNTGEYFIQNDIRTLDQYGEWYYNSSNGKLSVYWGGIDPSTKTTKVSIYNNLITNTSGDYVVIDGLDLQGSNSSSILFSAGTDFCQIKNCSISFSGGDGINISGTSNIIDDCNITSVNGGGVVVNGASVIVTNNVLSKIGIIEGQISKIVTVCAMTLNGNNPSVSYNYILQCGYMGVYIAGGAITASVTYNRIDKPCLVLQDSGGIYLGHTHTGTVIDNNIVSNSLGNGIYLDEYCTGVTVSDNTVFGCSNNGIKLHKSFANTITGNTSFNNGFQIIFENHVATEDNLRENIVNSNKFIAKSGQYALRFYNSYNSTAIGTLNNNYYARPVDDDDVFTTYLVGVGQYTKTLTQWKTFSSQDANSLGSPITVNSDDDIYFYYNPTKNDSTVVLLQPGIDVTGQAYVSPITLAPYSSIVILRDSSTGTYYYVSSSTGSDGNAGTQALPWASLTKVNSASLVEKDRVLFKSGDSWYGQLVPKSGSALGDITYSSYGTGNKPLIHSSSIITNSSNWTNHSGNIWKKINQPIEICNLIFNNDSSFGKRKWSTGALANQGDWFWDSSTQILYLYSNTIPSNVYQSIRTVNKLNLISASSKSYITIDGLALKYGDYGFVGTNTDHVTIKNCDVALIGGSQTTGEGRKGNGIEFWASNSNALVQTCNIWECFDAGITNQSSIDGTSQSGITYKNNKIWNCEYGYEYFNTGTGSSTSNILLEYNIFENSGMGWGHSQRSNPSGYSLRLANRNEATHSSFVIRNNIFNVSAAESHHNWDTTYALYTIDYNYYYQPTANIAGINFTTYYSTAQFGSYKSATGWDAHSLALTPSTIVDLSVYRNDTNEQVVLPLGSQKVDLTGQKKVSSIVLPAYTPAFLMVDHNPDATTNPTGKKKILTIGGKQIINSKTGKTYVK